MLFQKLIGGAHVVQQNKLNAAVLNALIANK